MTPTASAARDWLLSILRGLVPEPESIDILVAETSGILELNITTPPALRARILGRNGHSINAVRDLAKSYAAVNHIARMAINVLEPERNTSNATKRSESAVR